MSGTVAKRLAELGIRLPEPPMPIANYVPAVREGSLLFLSGQGPLDGTGWRTGKLGAGVSIEEGYAHARLTTLNLLAQIDRALGSLDAVARVVKVLGMVNSTPEFTDHPRVINGCSDLLVEVFGETIGRHARSAIGVASLPGGISVEIELVVAVRV